MQSCQNVEQNLAVVFPFSSSSACSGSCDTCGDRLEVQLSRMNGCDGSVLASFDVSQWNDDQLKRFLEFVQIDQDERETGSSFLDLPGHTTTQGYPQARARRLGARGAKVRRQRAPAGLAPLPVGRPAPSADIKSLSESIPQSHLRRFFILSELLSPADLLAFYDPSSIRHLRRDLREAGFDFPVRTSVPGPGRGKGVQ